MLLSLAACHPPPTAAPHPTPATKGAENVGDSLLAKFDASPYAYEIALLERSPEQAQRDAERYQSDGGSAPFSVRLLKHGEVVDQTLLFQASCGRESVREVKHILGGDREAQSWTTAGEHCDIGIATRLVALAPQIVGLLVTQAMGYEYRYNSHTVFVARDDKLLALWTYTGGLDGSDRTSANVLANSAGQQELALVEVQRNPDRSVAQWSAQRLRFAGSSAELTSSPLPDESAPLFVLDAGSPETKSDSECIRALDLFRASAFPGLTLPDTFWGSVFSRESDAQAVRGELAKCEVPRAAKIVVYRSTSGG